MTHEEFKKAFDEAQAKLRGLLQTQGEEIKEHGSTLANTRDEIKKAEKKYNDLFEQFADRVSKLEVANKRAADAPAAKQRLTPGQIVSGSDIAKGWSGPDLDTRSIDVKSFTPWIEQKTVSSTQVSDMILPYRAPGIVAAPDRPLIMRDLLSATPIQTDSIEYIEETGFYQLYTQVATQAAAIDTDLVVDNAQGFYPGQTVTIHGTSTLTRVIDTGGVDLATNTLTFTAAFDEIVAVDVNVTADTFVYTPEAQLKPQAHLEMELKTGSIKTLAHWVPVTRQVLADLPRLRSYIDGKLLLGLALSEEQQILYGNNSTTELQGICTHSGINTYLWSTGEPGDSKIDALRRAMTLSLAAQYPVDGIILNPYDWEDIQLTKDDSGRYIWIDVQRGGTQVMWQVPVVVSTAMSSGYFLLGSFSLGASLYDRERSNIRVSESHSDFFARNMIAILAEERMGLVIERPASFVYGQFDGPPGAP